MTFFLNQEMVAFFGIDTYQSVPLLLLTPSVPRRESLFAWLDVTIHNRILGTMNDWQMPTV